MSKLMNSWAGIEIKETVEPWHRYKRVIDVLETNLPAKPSYHWLDLGCQFGQFIKVAQENFNITAFGLDDFKKSDLLNLFRKFDIPITDPNLVYDKTWTYQDRQLHETGINLEVRFDVISALEIIEHMIDTDAFLRDCHKHLNHDGTLIISTPNINSLRNRVTVPFGFYPVGMEYRNQIHHVRLYNSPKLIEHVESHGFELIDIQGVSFLPQRFLVSRIVRNIDRILSSCLHSYCGNIISVFRKSGNTG